MERDLVGNVALVVREVKLWKYQHQQHLFLLLLLNSNVKQELRHRIQTLNIFYYSE